MKLPRGFSLTSVRYSSRIPKLAIIGSGPAAFYTALHVLKSTPMQIDMFEQNPTPYGLVRYGVAPDHPEVKNCIERFKDVEEYGNNFKFFGNVKVGSDIKLADLYENYNGVLYAYGSSDANIPNIAGVEHSAVIDSKSFVGWYNNDPNHKNLNPPLEKAKTVTIVGNGNVAIDIVRILLSKIEHWEKTDISDYALEKLKISTVSKVNVVARKGVLESKFTNKELRELLEMENVGFVGYNKDLFEIEGKSLDRINKRRISLLDKFSGKQGSRAWELHYLKNPIGFKVENDQLLKELIISKNKIVKYEDGTSSIEPKMEFGDVDSDLVILATGYKATPLEEFENLGVPFENGLIPNDNGKVIGKENSYCVGWVATGSTGNINSTVLSSSIAAETITADMAETSEEKPGRKAIEDLLRNASVKPITWKQWLDVENKEIELGAQKGKSAQRLSFDEIKAL